MSIQFKKRLSTNVLMLHSSHTPPSVPRAMGYLKWKGRGMGLLEIGYHFVIDRDGSRTETRPMALIGQASTRFNATAVHVCLMGGMAEDYVTPEDNFTEDQRAMAFDTIRWLKGIYGGVSLMGHSEAVKGHKLPCPEFDMNDFRSDYLTYVATGGSLV